MAGINESLCNVVESAIRHQVANMTIEDVLRKRGSIIDGHVRSEEHTSELQSRGHLVCRLLLEKKKEEEKIYSRYTILNVYKYYLYHFISQFLSICFIISTFFFY